MIYSRFADIAEKTFDSMHRFSISYPVTSQPSIRRAQFLTQSAEIHALKAHASVTLPTTSCYSSGRKLSVGQSSKAQASNLLYSIHCKSRQTAAMEALS